MSTTTNKKTTKKTAAKAPEPKVQRGRWTVVAILAAAAFFGTYSYASAKTGAATASALPEAVAALPAATADGSGAAAGGCGGGCCGGGAPAGAATTKTATIEGDVQRITVDLSKGYYDPTTIELKAGVPAEITFGQGGGCLAQVQSQDLGFFEDLSGGAKTVKLAALAPGTYAFSCGMQMVFGSIVVK
ncbi:MAG: cupredoxin domain-containing protein [Coriobacteriia bacterium]